MAALARPGEALRPPAKAVVSAQTRATPAPTSVQGQRRDSGACRAVLLCSALCKKRSRVLPQNCPSLHAENKRPLEQLGWIQTSGLRNAGCEEAALHELSRALRSKPGAMQKQPSWLQLVLGRLPPANPRGSCLPLQEFKSRKSILWDSGFCVTTGHLNASTSARERAYFRNK